MPNGHSATTGMPGFTGFHIVRLSEAPEIESDSLAEIVRHRELKQLGSFLDDRAITSTRRAVRSISRKRILRLEARAEDTRYKPINSLTSYFRIDVRHITDQAALSRSLASIPGVSHAYPELKAMDPSPMTGSNPYSPDQGFLAAAPDGIDARWAWSSAGVKGEAVRVVDIEQGWLTDHPDLPAFELLYGSNRDGVGAYVGNHGAAVLGEVAAVDNDIGVIGIAPGISAVGAASHYEAASGTDGHVADAICAVLDSGFLERGDVLLLEVQRVNTHALPTEVDPLDLEAIRLATALGIIVIEAAGNGNQDLDQWTDSAGKRQLDPANAAFIDSGAIMVGSAEEAVTGAPPGHRRYASSNHGRRVDCYAWGDKVVTTGYGDLNLGAGSIAGYTGDFEETSAASAIVAGAAAIVQSKYKADTGDVVTPGEMRTLLSDPALNTPQDGGTTDPIGVMPDLKNVIEEGLPSLPTESIMKTNYLKIYGPILAFVLLFLYVFLAWHMIQEIIACGRAAPGNVNGCNQPFPEGITKVVTLIGGLVSALVVAHLAKADDVRSLFTVYLRPQPSRTSQQVLAFLIGSYIFLWFVVGLAALIVSVVMYPGVKNVVPEIGMSWLGVALAAVYALFGLKSR